MPITTQIQYEVTDTFDGEANYSWVKRGVAPSREGENYSDMAAIRRVKKAIGWNGVRCSVESDGGDGLVLHPVGMCQVCFITFYPFGSAS